MIRFTFKYLKSCKSCIKHPGFMRRTQLHSDFKKSIKNIQVLRIKKEEIIHLDYSQTAERPKLEKGQNETSLPSSYNLPKILTAFEIEQGEAI